MPDQDFEASIQRFELAWNQLKPWTIEETLANSFPIDDSSCRKILTELICIDLEYRHRYPAVRSPLTLTEYVERFPDLISVDRLTLELIGEDYRCRSRWGDRPSHRQFITQFQERHSEILAELQKIDIEIIEESQASDFHPSNPYSFHSSHLMPETPFKSERAWLSHHDFLLKRLIGAGRMGKVYEAYHYSNEGNVAVKFLRKSLCQYPELVGRFIEEARTVEKLRHPNLVGTQGLGRTPGGAFFLVMDLVVGKNLRIIGSERAVREEEAVCWGIAICEAIEHAHLAGIIHCDLKPANILLDETGGIRVTDFGLARSLHEETLWAAEVEGTVPFMAPEQISQAWGQIDQRTDVYGIGAVLYTLLTGRSPFVGTRIPDIFADILTSAPVPSMKSFRSDLSEPLIAVCRKCLAKRPEDRYQAVNEVRLALASLRLQSNH